MIEKKKKPRAWLVQAMRLAAKPGPMSNSKKQKSKKACREWKHAKNSERY
jgi:hypothetical protein